MKTTVKLATVAVVAAFILSGCATSGGTAAPTSDNSAIMAKIDAGLAALKTKVLSKGPSGEEPADAKTADLSDAEVAQVKALHLTAAIAMHYGGNDWSTAQIAGLKSEFTRLGIEVVAVTDANFDAGKQVSDIETIMAKKPSIVVSLPTDPVATADAYRKASAGGAHLVFMDNVPKGFVAGKDYVSAVSADNYGNGVTSAYLMARALGGKGTIGIIFHQADFFVTKQRYEGFKTTIKENFPDIKIVEEKGIAGPDFAGDAQGVASAMLTKHPTLSGIWGVWDVPADHHQTHCQRSG